MNDRVTRPRLLGAQRCEGIGEYDAAFGVAESVRRSFAQSVRGARHALLRANREAEEQLQEQHQRHEQKNVETKILSRSRFGELAYRRFVVHCNLLGGVGGAADTPRRTLGSYLSTRRMDRQARRSVAFLDQLVNTSRSMNRDSFYIRAGRRHTGRR